MLPSLSARWAIVGLLATAGCDRASSPAEQANGGVPAEAAGTVSPDEAAPATPADSPKAGAVDRSHAGEKVPDLPVADAAGKETRLATFADKPLLVNLWATWCAPCVKELPTLDAAATAGAARFRTVAISQDMDPAKARDFLKARPLAAAAPLFDPKLGFSLALKANLPTTILYDATGAEVWRVTGELDWAGEKARALLAEAG